MAAETTRLDRITLNKHKFSRNCSSGVLTLFVACAILGMDLMHPFRAAVSNIILQILVVGMTHASYKRHHMDICQDMSGSTILIEIK